MSTIHERLEERPSLAQGVFAPASFVTQTVDCMRPALHHMKRTLPLLICLAHLLIPTLAISQQPASRSSVKQQTDSSAVDALWISIMPSRRDFRPGKRPKDVYFDLQSDGKFVFAEGDEPRIMKVVRCGVVPETLVRRAFQIVGKPSVLNAVDRDPGEPIFSDSDWVSIGFMAGGKVKALGGWAYQEEIKDFPREFQQLIEELRSVAAKLPPATNIKALLSAARVAEWRLKSMRRDRFIALDEATLNRLPVLKQAVFMSQRIIAVEDESQMNGLAELAKQMDPKAKYWGLYKIGEQRFYEIGAYYLQR